ncbi:uncharacterized protein LACBIDRAFT_333579 [Laccaria bicolor S238N-H82]|uniref:Predicted protein n=1 Tax=Laccaria bicolor (strain S238N-H82 / ATCC MYA-4686) TaxID=486041 RepID=B0DWD7_LACBS|nr:uncharacterized protein LACBIDRAFT_333579 [Laccaria bicolor S238N-H82]EDR01031.1 predicted protein [Laccaria bicolor S238N-H82]|eukprot:XP_001888250.1 predicted protein [Laccaria bicolor S238N-H82]
MIMLTMHNDTQRRQQPPRRYKSHTTWQRPITRMGGDNDDDAERQWTFCLDSSPDKPAHLPPTYTQPNEPQHPGATTRRPYANENECPADEDDNRPPPTRPTNASAHEQRQPPTNNDNRPPMKTDAHEMKTTAHQREWTWARTSLGKPRIMIP